MGTTYRDQQLKTPSNTWLRMEVALGSRKTVVQVSYSHEGHPTRQILFPDLKSSPEKEASQAVSLVHAPRHMDLKCKNSTKITAGVD